MLPGYSFSRYLLVVVDRRGGRDVGGRHEACDVFASGCRHTDRGVDDRIEDQFDPEPATAGGARSGPIVVDQFTAGNFQDQFFFREFGNARFAFDRFNPGRRGRGAVVSFQIIGEWFEPT